PVVPIFWMQSEDHDFEEIKAANLFAGDELKRYELNVKKEQLGGSVGGLTLVSDALESLKQLEQDFSGADGEILSALTESYQPGEKLGDAVRRFLQKLFAPYGLIFCDPQSVVLKAAGASLIRECFRAHTELAELLTSRAEQLVSNGYELQVKVRPKHSLFFLDTQNGRKRLEIDSEGNFRGSGEKLSLQDIDSLIEREPHRFTSSALVRPLLQDFIFPTAAYIAGPAEFKYWTQVTPLYRKFAISQPLVVPRPSFVVLEHRTRQLAEKLGLSAEVLCGEAPQPSTLAPSLGQGYLVEALKSNTDSRLADLEAELRAINPSLTQALTTTRSAVATNLERLRSKIERAELQRDTVMAQRSQRLSSVVWPNGEKQERIISFISYVLKYGRAFIDRVFRECPHYASPGCHLIVPEEEPK
ncbi:MAG: bacillithiol biosynthesis cysteine-adding enzyme BshC, partial [Bdellovibrionales bacterium]|nr:bacillithiol biosynthesis cysteine-adding enzyme BshC [Bdellovibrionales bacterium]